MKRLSPILSILAACAALPALAAGEAHSCTIDLNAGTQGAGISLGYHINPKVRLRLRGAVLNYSYDENWSGSDARIKLYGNNIGLLVDYYPGEGNFYITAGLNFSENKMRCRSRLYRKPGMAAHTNIGGIEYTMLHGNMGEISGKYSWNHAQPYIGIGYQDSLFNSSAFYYSVDLGINFMGSGDLSVSSSDNLYCRNPRSNVLRPVSHADIEQSIRREGRDFFKIADDLCVYPVLQLGIGARF